MNSHSTNGMVTAENEPNRLRFVLFVESIVSDWMNPQATSTRALTRALQSLGHEVRILEERLNRPTRSYIEQRKSDPAAIFHAVHPDLNYFTFDIPVERESMVWIGREITGADAMICRKKASSFIAPGLRRLDAPLIINIIEDDNLATSNQTVNLEAIVFDERLGQGIRSQDLLVVAYDDDQHARSVSDQFPRARRIVSGAATLPDWEFVPEVRLPEIYRDTQVAVVVDSLGDGDDLSRLLLPLGSGSYSIPVCAGLAHRDVPVPLVAMSDVGVTVEDALKLAKSGCFAEVPEEINAMTRASSLVTSIEQRLASKRVLPSSRHS